MTTHRLVLAMMLLISVLSGTARAETCYAEMVNEPRVGGWCWQGWVDFFWNAYDFDRGDWDQGFGFSNACDLSRPLGRTFNAIYVLNYADGPGSKSTNDFSGSILHWGGNYSMREIDELDARCYGSSTTTRAYTRWGIFVDNYTQLYLPFFYNENVVERAGTILHEARHADWCGHNGNDGSNACPSGSNSCDESFGNGCDGIGSPSGRGGTGYQALWLWWFTVDSDNITGTTTRKEFARDEANRIFDTMFDVDPCINITSTGAVINTCPTPPSTTGKNCPSTMKCCGAVLGDGSCQGQCWPTWMHCP